jgi:hypothetical protein
MAKVDLKMLFQGKRKYIAFGVIGLVVVFAIMAARRKGTATTSDTSASDTAAPADGPTTSQPNGGITTQDLNQAVMGATDALKDNFDTRLGAIQDQYDERFSELMDQQSQSYGALAGAISTSNQNYIQSMASMKDNLESLMGSQQNSWMASMEALQKSYDSRLSSIESKAATMQPIQTTSVGNGNIAAPSLPYPVPVVRVTPSPPPELATWYNATPAAKKEIVKNNINQAGQDFLSGKRKQPLIHF